MSSFDTKQWFVDDLERFVVTKLWSAYQTSPNERWVNFYYDESPSNNKERPPYDLLAMTLEDFGRQRLVELDPVGFWSPSDSIRTTYKIYRARLTNAGVRYIEQLIKDNSPKKPIGFESP